MKTIKDLKGQKFGRLTVVEIASKDVTGKIQWLCECECGNKKIIRSSHLKSGHTSSCGCWHKEVVEKQFFKHGHCINGDSCEYNIHQHMYQRCYNKNNPAYPRYGGRGIKLTDRWLGQNGFINFYQDMGPRPGFKYTIDRIDNNGDYSKENCRWATRREQANNTRRNRYLTYNKEILTTSQWAQSRNINASTLYIRIDKLGWSIERALNTPIRKIRKG